MGVEGAGKKVGGASADAVPEVNRPDAEAARPKRRSMDREARLLVETRARTRPSFRRNLRAYERACA